MNTKQSAQDTTEYERGFNEGFKTGVGNEKTVSQYFMAQEMRVLFCALITAQKVNDSIAFFATVEIVKKTLSAYANFEEKDWDIFRTDIKHTEKQKEKA